MYYTHFQHFKLNFKNIQSKKLKVLTADCLFDLRLDC
jgi:hypothetical protein